MLASLGAGGVLAGVVEGLLSRLLVSAQGPDGESPAAGGDDAAGAGAGAQRVQDPEAAGGTGADSTGVDSTGGDAVDGDGGEAAPGLFVGESGGDAVLVAAGERYRVLGVEEASSSGLMGLGAGVWGSWPRPATAWGPGLLGVRPWRRRA